MMTMSASMKNIAVLLIISSMVAMPLFVIDDCIASDESTDFEDNAVVIDGNTKEGIVHSGMTYIIGEDYATLELKDVNLTTRGLINDQSWIRTAVFISTDMPIHIQLVGENNVTLDKSDDMSKVQSGIYCNGTLVIEGTGTLCIDTVDAITTDGNTHAGIYNKQGNTIIRSNVKIDVGNDKTNVANSVMECIRCENGNLQIYKGKVEGNIRSSNEDPSNSFCCIHINRSGSLINDSTAYFVADATAKTGNLIGMYYQNADGFKVMNSSFWCQSGNIPASNCDFKTTYIQDVEGCLGLINGNWEDLSHVKIIEAEKTFGLRIGPNPVTPEKTADNNIVIVLGFVILIALVILAMTFLIRKSHSKSQQ